MNISTSDLKRFQRLSSPITGKNILPILDYVKIGGGRIVKSVLTSFVQFDCNSADEDMLVEENLLNIKIGKSANPTLKFSKKGNKVTITDSVVPTTDQTMDIKEFPTIPEPTSERFPVSENFLKVLQKAQHFPAKYDPQNISWMSFIMIGDGYVCASDGHAFFMEPVDEEFKVVLDNRNAQILSKMPINGYAFSDNYMFFYGDGFTIGFGKQEIGYTNISGYGNINGSKMEFTASASDFQRFNDECAQSSKLPWITISKGKVSMNDKDYDRLVEMPMPSVTPSDMFTYNAKTMNRLLMAIGGDEIEFYRGKDWYWIKSPSEKSTTLLMKLLDDGI